jgi:hypothetical protein
VKSINRDTVCALALLVFCAVFFWSSTSIKDMGYESMSSEMWPRIILGVLTVFSLIYLVRSLSGPLQNADDDADIAVRPAGVSWLSYYRNVIICFLLFGVFLVTLPYLGMLIGGVLFVFAMLCALGGWSVRKMISHAVIALLAMGGMWAVFTYGLNVILPQGELLRII